MIRRGSGEESKEFSAVPAAKGRLFPRNERRAAEAVRLPCVFILGGRKRIGLGVPFADSYCTRNFLQNYEVRVNSL